MKRVVVTGGAGFVGSNLVRRLLSKGYQVTIIDNLSTGSYANIADLVDGLRCIFIKHDITTPVVVDEIDWIFNAACAASPPQYQRDPIHTMKTNVLGMLMVLELARSTHARVVQCSTSEVYGDPHVHPQTEAYWGHVNPIGVRACYDEGKRAAETLCFDYQRIHKVDVRVARIFNTYGPYMDPQDGRVVSNFIMRALNKLPLELYGGGMQTRSFCFINDMVDGLMALMEYESLLTTPINLGNPNEIRISELVVALQQQLSHRLVTIGAPLPHDDPQRRKPDISKAKQLLGWQPKVDLSEGLRQTIAYFARRTIDLFSQNGSLSNRV